MMRGSQNSAIPLWRKIIAVILFFLGTSAFFNIGNLFWAIGETLRGDPDDWLIVGIPVLLGSILVTSGVFLFDKRKWRPIIGWCAAALAVFETFGILSLTTAISKTTSSKQLVGVLNLRLLGFVLFAIVSAIVATLLLRSHQSQKK